MSVDVSAVARVLGITTQFKDLRGDGVVYLPQRIAVLAQGSSDAVFSTTKFQATGAGQVGAIAGFGSPAHLVAKELFPSNGDGIGTIPATFYLLADHGSGVAATGDITPSGSQTKAAAYRVRVNNMLSEPFVIPVGASVTTICGLIHAAVAAVLDLPVKPTYAYGTVTAAADGGNAGNGTVTVLSVTGSPAVGVYTLELLTEVANGGVFRLTAPDGTILSSSVTMTPGVGGATVITVAGLQFTITDGTADFETGDTFEITVPATKVNLVSKWKGTSANDLYIEVVGEDFGTTFAITQPTGGLVNPSVAGALAQIGNVWESMLLNALNVEDTDALDAISTFGEGRWGTLVHKPLLAFVGNTKTTVGDATAVSATRRTDRTNAQLVAPGSKNLPFVVCARQLARIAPMANNNPATGYAMLQATGLTPGADGDQWDYLQRDQAVKLGSSTIEVNDGVVNLCDIVTFYRPTGDQSPAYRQVVNIVKLQTIIFNIRLIFATVEWASAPLIPDNQPTTNVRARKPKNAVTRINGKIQSLGDDAILSDPKSAKKTTVAAIDTQNADRLNASTTVQLSGNSGIVDVGLNFGFYFGAAAVVG
jgi:phage tail sheath gpL-like